MTRAEKWLLAGLGISVALNGLFAAMIFFHPGHPRDRHGPDVRLGRMEEHLSANSRAVLKETVQARRDTLASEFGAMRDARQGVADALAAEPFDQAALEAALARVREHQDVIQETVQASFVDAASKLPRDERIKLAKGGERFMRRMFDPRRDEKRDRPPPPLLEPHP
ncbi:periplasmic heavy metal sensor [Iodidimonas sp. SYSU 1G8]|uniref:periplasmic heavy metal sensor n=1 Tax=Iodidimonas sp. SYSU 1G8 TaxID=3133967 RepID=UPI0031FEEEFE